MLNKAAIRTAVSDDFSSNWKSQVLSELQAQGFTQAERDAVEPYLDNIVAQITPASDMGLDEFEGQIDSIAKPEITNGVSNKKAAEELKASEEKLEAHEVFNARTSLSYREPVFSEPRFTSPVNIQDADYSIIEDYPNSYGVIDEKRNWFKVNKKTGHVEFVHNSGTQIKIDPDGNVTEFVVGSFKRVIQGDFSEEVKGNYDLLVKGSMYRHVGGSLEDKIDGSKKSEVTGSLDEKVTGSVSENYSSSHTNKVASSSSVSAGSSMSMASPNTTLEGAAMLNMKGATVKVDGATIMVTSSGILMLSGAPLAFIGA